MNDGDWQLDSERLLNARDKVRLHVWPGTGEMVWCSDDEFAALLMYDGLYNPNPNEDDE